jgi:hypothetical protein
LSRQALHEGDELAGRPRAVRRSGAAVARPRCDQQRRVGHTVGKAIFFGYVPAEESGHAEYESETPGNVVPADRFARQRILA